VSPPTQLIIPVESSAFAATLAAMGVAAWLDSLKQQIAPDATIRIANRGFALVVTVDDEITPQQVMPAHYTPLVRWIATAKTGTPPEGSNVLNYEAEKQHNAEYYALLDTYRKARVNFRALLPDQQHEIDQRAPRPEWPVAAVVNQMGALSTYNKAVDRWSACRAVYPELARIVWTLCSGQPGAIEAAEAAWVALAKQHGLDKYPWMPATQVVNPEQGKGANRPKADALTIGGQDGFWLLEYFKYAGLYNAALPRTVQGRKDRKTYVIQPSREGVEWYWHENLFQQFQRQFWASSAIKMDVQASLRYTDLMIKEWNAAQQSSLQRHPSDFVDGFIVASFKDLGSAVAVMNVAVLRLPDWIEWPRNQQQAEAQRKIIAEHLLIIGRLDEKRGEEEQLLRAYRDFLSSRDPNLNAFFEFTTAYAGHTLRKMSKREPVQRLSTDSLKEIIMANDERRTRDGKLPLSDIVQNEGFRNIAAAIRASTVTQQYYKSQRDDNTYDVRYGLADELRRKARDPHEFIQALSEFLQQYSQENARVQERNKNKAYRRRKMITTDDIAQIVALIDRYDAPTVANLLIAYGYAYDPKAPDAGADAPSPDADALEPSADLAEEDAENPF
jgi:hypothetical protein